MDFAAQLENLKRSASAASAPTAAQPDRNNRETGNGNSNRRNNEYYGPRVEKRQRHGQNNRGMSGGRPFHNDRDSNLRNAFATLPPYRPVALQSSPKACTYRKVPHVALLFITIDDLPYESIWRKWASAGAASTNMHVSVVCHAKFPKKVQSSWLKQRLLVDSPIITRGNEYQPPKYHTRVPNWGSIEITRAMLDLLNEGLKIGHSREEDPRFSANRYSIQQRKQTQTKNEHAVTPVDKFIFVSESCLPVTTLQEVRNALFGVDSDTNADPVVDPSKAAMTTPTTTHGNANSEHMNIVPMNPPLWDVSWVNGRDTPNNGYSRQLQFDKMHSAIPAEKRWKADQWMLLSRQHAGAVMNIDRHLPRDMPLWRTFKNTKASDELYFPTALALLQLLTPSGDTGTSVSTAGNKGENKSPESSTRRMDEQVAIRRITYADWSESAKNPVSFTEGVQDLKRVAELARKEGCLFARKFCLFQIVPGQDNEGKQTTGALSMEEWNSTIQEFSAASTEKTNSKD